MKRAAEKYLDEWKNRKDRKPLVIRGARQVGKTYLAEKWGQRSFSQVLTINFERDPQYGKVFIEKDPNLILQQLSLLKARSVMPGTTLLILDEIQCSPAAISSLRYFKEELPELHILATGSLLDFALRELTFSAPVGRIEYLYLGPLTFCEFVEATHGNDLGRFLSSVNNIEDIPPAVHEVLLGLLRKYYFVGGMPEAVQSYATSFDLLDTQRIQSNILATFRDDFAKYRSRLDLDCINLVYDYSSQWPSRRSKYSEISKDFRASQIKKAFELLSFARLVHLVYLSAANGVPLAAECNRKFFKPTFLDIGLCNRACGLKLLDGFDQLLTVREGALAEQFVAQELLNSFLPFEEPQLFYWENRTPGSSAEVDFVIDHDNKIVPVEVKAAKRGSLRSLHVFNQKKNNNLAVRLSCRTAEIETISQGNHDIKLLSIPLYLAGRVKDLCGI